MGVPNVFTTLIIAIASRMEFELNHRRFEETEKFITTAEYMDGAL